MQDLKACARAWRKALLDADTGPLKIAQEVVAIADDWETYREAAGGKTTSAFLRRELGRGRDLAFFRRRANAVEKLGEHVRRNFHHEVAIWIAQNFEGPQMKTAVWTIAKETKQVHHGNAMTYAQAKPVVLKALNLTTEKQPRTCPRCAVLAEENRELREHLLSLGVAVS